MVDVKPQVLSLMSGWDLINHQIWGLTMLSIATVSLQLIMVQGNMGSCKNIQSLRDISLRPCGRTTNAFCAIGRHIGSMEAIHQDVQHLVSNGMSS